MATSDKVDVRDLYVAALLHDIGDAMILGKAINSRADHSQLGADYVGTMLLDDSVPRMIRAHHDPGSWEEMILAVADSLASGGRKGRHEAGALVSAFSCISVEGRKLPAPSYVPPVVYSHDSPAYPEPDEASATGGGERFKLQWELLDRELRQVLSKDNLDEQHETLLFTLQKYTSSLPALDTQSARHVSLYDHLKTTAAIAAAIAAANPTEHDLRALVSFLAGSGECEVAEREDLLLVGGDLSGIQSFIYEIPTDMAAKNLRGRSFLLGYLMKIVAERILRELKLPPANALLVGGGRFTLLLPRSAEPLINSFRHMLEEVLYDAFGGTLALLLSTTPLSYADLLEERFMIEWSQVGAALGAMKLRPWATLIAEDPRYVIGPCFPSENPCRACGRPAPIGEIFCPLCSDIIEVGARLTSSSFLSERRGDPSEAPIHRLDDVLARLGVSMSLVDKPLEGCMNYVLNDFEAVSRGAQGFYFVPQLRAVKDFEDLANASDGLKSWGVLRGDVDNLGLVFSNGLGDKVSLAELVGLSRSMNEFFGIYFNGILKQFKDQVYTVYAGGDDFFVVGSWSALPGIAATIRNEFGRYCAHNPSLTLSAALRIAPGTKFPVHRMADLVGESLDGRAKKATGKDAFAFLGAVFKWDELERSRKMKDLLVQIVDMGGSRSITHALYRAEDLSLQAEEAGSFFKVWQVVYGICRYEQRLGNRGAHLMKELLAMVLPDNRTLCPFLKQSARWAELELRGTR